ncbi:MAG: hypothetical protein Q8M20_18020 [Rhodocyclaceae bacterium]|nr:hypothetical protein [Rhodocyclaceae bacterium]
MAKKYDLAVKTGTYKAQDGTDKGRYETLGEIHPGRDGGYFARINAFRMLGLAMAAVARGDDSVLVSLFTPTGTQAPAAPGQQATNSAPPLPPYDDDYPF